MSLPRILPTSSRSAELSSWKRFFETSVETFVGAVLRLFLTASCLFSKSYGEVALLPMLKFVGPSFLRSKAVCMNFAHSFLRRRQTPTRFSKSPTLPAGVDLLTSVFLRVRCTSDQCTEPIRSDQYPPGGRSKRIVDLQV